MAKVSVLEAIEALEESASSRHMRSPRALAAIKTLRSELKVEDAKSRPEEDMSPGQRAARGVMETDNFSRNAAKAGAAARFGSKAPGASHSRQARGDEPQRGQEDA